VKLQASLTGNKEYKRRKGSKTSNKIKVQRDRSNQPDAKNEKGKKKGSQKGKKVKSELKQRYRTAASQSSTSVSTLMVTVVSLILLVIIILLLACFFFGIFLLWANGSNSFLLGQVFISQE
jgi:Flp pilus assembly protein TadB